MQDGAGDASYQSGDAEVYVDSLDRLRRLAKYPDWIFGLGFLVFVQDG